MTFEAILCNRTPSFDELRMTCYGLHMHPPLIIGSINVTPDSFHDGGHYVDLDTALARAKQFAKDGADIIEIGGESTGPNSKDVSLESEISRTIPVIKKIREVLPNIRLSIDTYKADVARQAIEAGVSMINDVTAGRGDPKMFEVVAQAKVSIVLMFAKDPTPRTTIAETQYEDVIDAVKSFLADRKAAAVRAGIPLDRIILDPGMGHFVSSDAKYSLQLIARLPELLALDCPLFLSPSRKSFLAGSENLKTIDRLPGTIAASAIAVLQGASYIRTHDVLEVRRACEIASEIAAYRR